MIVYEGIKTDFLKSVESDSIAMEIEVGNYLVNVEYAYPKFNLSMDCFWCEIAEVSPHLLEHEAAKWLPLHDLHQVKWLPADIKVVEAIEASVLSE